MIKKILKIKNFGSFINFEADNSLNEFKKYNLFFGLNGTGKTTLSSFFRFLNEGEISKDFDNKSYNEDFDILLDNNQHITEFQENIYCNYIKIFNRDFVNNNLTLDNNNAQTNALTYTIGETAKEIKNKISEVNKQLESYFIDVQGKKKIKAQNDYDNLNEELENIYKDTADIIRRDLNIKNSQEYNKSHFKQDYNKYCENDTTITEDEKNEYAKEYVQPIKNLIPEINFNILSDKILNQLEKILGTEYKRTNIKEELVQWIEKGLELKTEEICPFCNQTITNWQQRYEDIQKIVKKDDSFLEFEKCLQELLQTFNYFNNIAKNIVFTLRTEDFCNKVLQETLSNYSVAFKNYKNFLENTCSLLSQKKHSPDKIFTLTNTQAIQSYINARNTLNQLILEHNTNTANIKNVKNNAKNIVVNYYIQQIKTDVINRFNKLSILTSEIEKVKSEITTINNEIANLNAELTNQKAPMSEIERYIYIVFGCRKFTLTYDESTKSYYICRENGEIAKNLSEGEKTVIAFAYFLATLKTHNFDLKNAIIVIDDPVSSLDQQYLFNLINLLATKFNKPSSFEQLFILTHNFYFYKKIRAILKNKGKIGEMYQLFQITKENTSIIVNADDYLRTYTSEYTHTIKYLRQVYQMEDSKIKEIPLGNSIRKILEIFLAFRCPRQNTIFTRYEIVTKNISEDEKCKYKYLQDIANASSHTEECEDLETLEEFKLFVTKNEIEQLFNFIKLIDEKHYDEIMQL